MTSRPHLLLPLLVAALAALHCSDPAPDEGRPLTGSAERRKLLSSLAARVVLPTLRDFAGAAETLDAAVTAHEAAIGAGDDTAATLAESRDAFVTAMHLWQRVEMMQFGPAGDPDDPDMVMGGRALRDAIYSFPANASCRVDQALVADPGFAGDDFFIGSVEAAYGLDALSYLLFVEGDAHSCGERAAIETDGTWAAAVAAGLDARRAAYATRLAARIAEEAAELRDAWEADGDDFAAAFSEGQDVYDSPHEVLDAVFAGLFYLDLTVKDRKLAIPAGISIDCTSERCPDDVEGRWAGQSGAYVQQNVAALSLLYHGGDVDDPDAYGFDDLLRALDAAEVADALEPAVAEAVSATGALDPDLATTVTEDLPRVVEAHAAVKAVTDLLKSQLVTALGLRVPLEGAGDND